MLKSDYQVILTEALKKQNVETQLQQCLEQESAIESDHSLEWAGAGFVLGVLSSVVLVYSLK